MSIQWDSFQNIVAGKGRDAEAKHHGINPVTGEELWAVPIAGQQDVDDAVEAATKAYENWRFVPAEKRKELIMKYCDVWVENAEKMTDLLCKETGKPVSYNCHWLSCNHPNDVLTYHSANSLPWKSTWSPPSSSTSPPSTFLRSALRTRRRSSPPVTLPSVSLVPSAPGKNKKCISTFSNKTNANLQSRNFPLVLSMGKVVPALLTGNAIIVKPSPFTPYTALKAIELAQSIFEPGLVQALGGDDKLGPMMTAHPDIAKISFTGSIATGKKIMSACANTLKRCTLELGGNDASIILPDVDIKATAPQVVMGALQNSGQVCVATKRIYIHESIYKEFLEEMVNFTKTIQVGDSESGSLLGPVQNKMQYEKVKEFFADTKKNGYKFAIGEDTPAEGKGFFIKPTIIDNPPNDSRIIAEEPFGPIVPTQPWSDEEEVIKRANNTQTGLGACVWGKDVAHAEKIAKRLEAGSVFVNSFEKPTPQAIFGGHKQSGIGGEWGTEGIKAYCNPHVIHLYK